MAQLAIQGHATREKEVIKILEMLGGENEYKLNGYNIECAYYIKNGVIHNTTPVAFNNFKLLTLEMFLERFPYKVGGKVFAFGNKWTVVDAVWDGSIEEVVYTIKSETSGYTTTKLSNQLQPYKEGAMDKAIKAVFDAKVQCCDIMNDIIKKDMKKIKIDIPAGYEFAGVDDNAQQVVFAKIQPEYPKTYESCCMVLQDACMAHKGGYKGNLMQAFQKLLICRDAYWQIAGDEYQLGKPWEPDYTDKHEKKYAIWVDFDKIRTGGAFITTQMVLTFPTIEMRDAFYENFKELINQCKELL